VAVIATLQWSFVVYSADGRRLTCVLHNMHRGHGSADIVYTAYTVVADVVQAKTVQMEIACDGPAAL